MSERLDKVVAAAGAITRKEARAAIAGGRVTVDGEAVSDPGRHVDAAHARIALDDDVLRLGRIVLMLNKPAGLITANDDARARTVFDLLPEAWARRLFAVGRLDRDTVGLLLLTDDGELCHRLISPRYGIEKEYRAVVDGPLSPELVEAFARGVDLGGGETALPAQLVIERAAEPGEARVVVREGKYHQIKRMFAAFGHTVTVLGRLRIGGVRLDPDLPPGAYRSLAEEEIAALFSSAPVDGV